MRDKNAKHLIQDEYLLENVWSEVVSSKKNETFPYLVCSNAESDKTADVFLNHNVSHSGRIPAFAQFCFLSSVSFFVLCVNSLFFPFWEVSVFGEHTILSFSLKRTKEWPIVRWSTGLFSVSSDTERWQETENTASISCWNPTVSLLARQQFYSDQGWRDAEL